MTEEKGSKPQSDTSAEAKSTVAASASEKEADERDTKSQTEQTTDNGQPKREPPLLQEKAQSVGKAAGKPVKKGRGVAWFALLVALLSGAAAGYSYWLLQQYQTADSAENQQSEQQLLDRVERQIAQRNARLEQQIADQDATLRAQQQALEEMGARVAAVRLQVGEITHVSRTSWMLAEAEYLLRLANQRLVMEQQTDSALALLKATDQILQDVDDINLHPVRAAIAQEIVALRRVGDTDIEGVFLELSALTEQLLDLPLLSPQPKPEQQDSDRLWPAGVENALAHFQQLVTVRHRQRPVAPLLPPDQHYYLQQNLRLMLEQAQLALLQRKPDLYRRSLSKAEQWVADYFELNHRSTLLLESIADLKQLKIAPTLPDISKSLALLKGYLADPDLPLNEADEAAEVSP